MRSLRCLLIVLFTLIPLLSPLSVHAETEPNNTLATANPIGIGLNNGEVNAMISPLNDDDYYKFTTEANRTYVIETYNIQGTLQGNATGLYLYNSGGTLLDDDRYGSRGTGTANARIQYTFITAGTYYILVKDDNWESWTGSYSLRILPKYDEPGAAWDANNDYEPNDAMVLANEIKVGLANAVTRELKPNQNFMTNDSDNDYYRFTTEANRTYVIETYNIQGTLQGNATGLYLYNSGGTLLDDDRYGSRGTGTANARIQYTFITAGTYYILVKDDNWESWTGSYSLRILPKYDEPGAAWDANNDYEPNDAMVLANTINLGPNNALTRQLAPHNVYMTNYSDYDFYHFEANANTKYVIETFNVPNNSTAIYLYNSGATELANDQYGQYGNGLIDARVNFTILTPGRYFILIKDRAGEDWTGTYSVRVCADTCLRSVYIPLVRK